MNPTRILVVEDESIIALDIQVQLRHMGYEVPAVAATGEEAIQLAATWRPDLILMDIRLQGDMDGITAAMQIQASQDIPIVYLTAYADELTLQRAKVSGPFGYILKPFEERELHSTIQMALYRHHVSQQLRDSEERYRRLFEQAPDAIFILQGQQILLANTAAAHLLAVPSPQDLVDRSIAQFVMEGCAAFVGHDAVQDPKLDDIILRLHDGKTVYVERTAITLPYQGETAVQIIARDITARRHAAEAERVQRALADALRETAAKLSHSLHLDDVIEAVLSHIQEVVPHDAAAMLLMEEGHVYVAQLSAYPPGMNQRDMLLEHRWPLVGSVTLAPLLDVEEPVSIPDPINTLPNLDISWVQSNVVAPVRSKGNLLGFIVLVSHRANFFAAADRQRLQAFANQAAIAIENAQLYQQVQAYASVLEQRVEARTAELDQERRRLQTILDTASEAIYLTDAYGTLQYANPVTEQVTGYTLPELEMQINQLWQNQETPQYVLQALNNALALGTAWHGEVVSRRKNGSLYDAALSVNPLYSQEDHLEGFVYVQRDITHFKELHRLKDQFASQIGHELRTPVTNLKLYLDLLTRRPDNLPKYLPVLVRETGRLEKLVEGCIEISALTADLSPVVLGVVDLNELTTEMLRPDHSLIDSRNLTLKINLAPSAPLAVADGLLIGRALDKVWDNALHYANTGGEITVFTEMTIKDNRQWATLTIHNTGRGIPTEERPYIFQRFYRGKIAQELAVPGAGLGLSICHTIMDRLNGHITVSSTPEKGTTFTLWLPPA
ncbi:MAG: PAS domain S-box protein [Chloroflexota bacterium]